MAQVLEVLELPHEHGVAEMQVGRGRVEPGLYAQGTAGLARFFEAFAQIGDADDLRGTLPQVVQLLVDGEEVVGRCAVRHAWRQYRVRVRRGISEWKGEKA